MYSGDTPDGGLVRTPGGREQDGARFHPAARDGTRVKTGELFISGIFQVVFSDHGGRQVTETADGRGVGGATTL